MTATTAASGEDAGRRLSDGVRQGLRAAIAETGGREIFALLRRRQGSALFDEWRLAARGHESAVPAVMAAAQGWEFCVHNHPSGGLIPSEADLAVAATLAERGIGSGIIDNAAQGIYVVVEPIAETPRQALDLDEIDAIFAPDGPLAALYAKHYGSLGAGHSAKNSRVAYEDRAGQRRMARLIAEAMNEDRIAVIEAGTGTGKSLAYLVPSLLWAVRNREKVVVSTHTLLLQRQLIEKDIPFAVAALGLSAKVVSATGRGNFACRRRVLEAAKAPATFFDDEKDQREVQDLIRWVMDSPTGHRDELSVPPSPTAWEKVASATDKSLKSKCPHYADCFYYRSRREADQAHLIVANHHLLLSDLAVKEAKGSYDDASVLPPYKRLVLDEAHHLEDVAAKHLGAQISRRGVSMLFGRLRSHRGDRGLLPFAQQKLIESREHDLARFVEERLTPEFQLQESRVEAAFDRIHEAMLPKLQGIGSIVDISQAEPDWEPMLSECREAASGIRILGKTVQSLSSRVKGLSEDWVGTSVELASVALRLASTADTLEVLAGGIRRNYAAVEDAFVADKESRAVDTGNPFGPDEGESPPAKPAPPPMETPKDLTRWLEIGRAKGEDLKIASSPLDIASRLGNTLFRHVGTVVLTSATLAVGDSFDFLQRRVGYPVERSLTLIVPSPFDYAGRCTLATPLDYPDPKDARFADWLPRALLIAARASLGRMFALFTSHALMKATAAKLRPSLEAEGFSLILQGEQSRSEILARFRALPKPVLLGTDSFWEGVDIQGDGLIHVVIPRLPFRVPDHPIERGRLRRIEEQGGNPFDEYSVPCAVIKFKQGFGRLIRSRRDFGAVLVLDPRLIKKRYGRAFIESLPGPRRLSGKLGDLLERLRDEVFLNAKWGQI